MYWREKQIVEEEKMVVVGLAVKLEWLVMFRGIREA